MKSTVHMKSMLNVEIHNRNIEIHLKIKAKIEFKFWR